MNFHTSFLFLVLALSVVEPHNLTETQVLEFIRSKELQKAFPFYISGYDADGSPIFIIELGSWDFKTNIDAGGEKFDRMDICADQFFFMVRKSAKTSKSKKSFVIADLGEFGFSQATHLPTLHYLVRKFSIAEEIIKQGYLKKAWLLNTNWIFAIVWNFARPVLPTLVKTVDVYGTYRSDWEPLILKELPKDQIPRPYGGTKDYTPVAT